MSTVGATRRALRRQVQDVSADKVVVNLEGSSPVVGSRRGAPAPAPAPVPVPVPAPAPAPVAGDRNLPIDVEAIEDEVQAVSPSRVPPRRRNRRTRRGPVTVVDLEAEASWEGNKRQRTVPDWGQGSSLQSNIMQTVIEPAKEVPKEPAKEVPKEPIFTCPICWNKMEEPSTTTCGHIFCDTCIKQAIKVQKKCPTCRKGLRVNSAHRIYLPNTAS